MTLEQILEETRRWPVEKRDELLDRLTEDLHGNAEIDVSWKTEVRRRLKEVENGSAEIISGSEVSARVRKIVGK